MRVAGAARLSALDMVAQSTKPSEYNCEMSKSCPENHFAFKNGKWSSQCGGTQNLPGRQCFVFEIIWHLMSGVKNNVRRGVNVASFMEFLRSIQDGQIVLMGTESITNLAHKGTSKYEVWPKVAETKGCIPLKQDNCGEN
ncbi:unnamed protein product [Nyctereutes procyonoides]|uniref:(raccoon dog) hypothetical protein n=1 Tax=Nyctereutes procyonoides TaxID=34880 RepID=A0A811ZN64_NYCPR|nr:unnamed protein product [Nyctereutes procyonoides]